MFFDKCNVEQILLSELKNIGLDDGKINHIIGGGDIYSASGLLDSASLVSLIAGLCERIENELKQEFDLFSCMDSNFLAHFKNMITLTDYLVGSLSYA
ncbi:hypothetical protein [Vibrio spartinae]|uniref:Carrier domain-containing protein n=1 Tax=Vibrio spartinae TaxID=1918945 RepID=A0A1N6M571_9VIBR|nr:hypothetical protein [Vibrio spartinae]QMV15007.1 hypothetical protein Vspart_02285 [Vibrio spartinae]SIO94591.1 hypothetical protein VSP9026_02316 [Vibrio spartinae]